MPPILTFTANIVAETTYYVSDWKAGQTSRATRERFQVGGKGINVSKMLQRLGADTTAICFPGGDFGPICEQWLKASAIPHKSFPNGCVTRSGSVIRSPGKEELPILGLDSVVSENAVQNCIDFLSSIKPPFVLALCGVIPNWKSPNWNPFRMWLQERPEGITLALDTYGPALEWLLQHAPDIVKINRDELGMLLSDPDSPTQQLLQSASERFACPLWVITDGEQPIWHQTANRAPASIRPPSVACMSPVGCGDVFFATLLDQLYSKPNFPLKRAIERAAAYASRNASTEGIADFDLE